MAKTTAPEILNLGFTPEAFRKNSTDFGEFVLDAINNQAEELAARIGQAAYDSTSEPNKTYVKKAEKNLVAAEMLQRRINLIVGNANGTGEALDTSSERAQREDYLEHAEFWITKLVATGGTVEENPEDLSGFASGSLVTSHFPEAEE